MLVPQQLLGVGSGDPAVVPVVGLHFDVVAGYQAYAEKKMNQSRVSWGRQRSRRSAVPLSLYDGLDLSEAFEVTREHLLQKRLKDRCRGLKVQQNLCCSLYNGLDLSDA